jgi:hypothetical protein
MVLALFVPVFRLVLLVMCWLFVSHGLRLWRVARAGHPRARTTRS